MTWRLYGDELILYYSDQRDPKHGQQIVHQRTRDLRNWDPLVQDVAYSDKNARPGMATVAKLPNGKYIYTYEYGGAPGSRGYPIHYRLSDDPRNFAKAPDSALVANRVAPSSSPFCIWTPFGGPNGTIIVSAYQADIYTNRALGDANAWVAYKVPQPSAYTRSLMVTAARPELLLIMGAGNLPPSTSNRVSLSVVDLSKLISV